MRCRGHKGDQKILDEAEDEDYRTMERKNTGKMAHTEAGDHWFVEEAVFQMVHFQVPC